MKVLVNTNYYRETFEGMPQGIEVDFAPEGEIYHVREISDHLQGYDALVIPSLFPVSNELIDAFPQLKLICNLGAGFNNVDLEYSRRKGVTVCNTPDAVTQPTAELAMALILDVMRKTAQYNMRIRKEKESMWVYSQLTGWSLEGKTLGIVGMGKIGRRLAEMAQVFRMQVVYYNPKTEVNGYRRCSLDELLAVSDVVSLHIPLNENTHHLIGASELSRMKPGAVLVNTARGPVVDEDALLEVLRMGHLSGAALDVHEFEPHVKPEFYDMPQVVLTPHIGGNTQQTLLAMMRDSAQNVVAYYEGKPIRVVNPIV